MRRSSLVPTIAAAVLVAAGAPVAASANPSAGTAAVPAPVSRVQTFDDRHGVSVDWVDPSTSYNHVVVRYRRGPHAPTHRHGTFQGHRVRVGPYATSAKLTHLSRDTVYSVTIWTVNARGARSTSRHTHFTTGGGHVAHGRYTARFVDTSGHPLDGVRLEATSYTTGHGYSATSTRSGNVTLQLPVGPYYLSYDASRATGGISDPTGYVGTDSFVTIDGGRTRNPGSVTLRAAGAVRVRVLDAAGGPVADAHPELIPLSPYVQRDRGGNYMLPDSYFEGTMPLGSERTDANGDATVTGVPPSAAFQICVNPASYSGVATDPAFGSACTSAAGLARPGGVVGVITLTVRRRDGGAITGTVRVPRPWTGHAHGTSFVYVRQGHQVAAAVPTRSDGRFRTGGLAPGRYRVCASDGSLALAGRTGYLPACAQHTVTVGGGTTRSVTIVRRVAAAATGTLTGPHGSPVAGLYVTGSRFSDQSYGLSDSLGHYLLKGLTPGRHSLCIDSFGETASADLPFGVRGDCGKHRLRFASRAGQVRTGLDVRLKVGAAVSGTIVDRRGRPVPFADVIVSNSTGGSDTQSDERGRFEFVALEPSAYKLCGVNIPGPTGYDLDELEDLLPGDGPATCLHRRIQLRPGHRTAGLRLVLPTAAAVHVTAVDEDGRGVAGVSAAVITSCHEFCDPRTTMFPAHRYAVVAAGLTNSRGSILLDGLRPGHYAVCLFAYYGTTRSGAPSTGYTDRCSGSAFEVTVRAGHTTVRRLVLHPAGSVSGRITDAEGQPVQGVMVDVAGSAASDVPPVDLEFEGQFANGASAPPGYFSTTAADGTYTVRSVRPGDRSVCVDARAATGRSSAGGYLSQCEGGRPGSTSGGAPVAVRRGATIVADFALTAGAQVSGTVTSKRTRSSTTVVLFRGQTYVRQVTPSTSGAYSFSRLIAGDYTVCAASFGYTSGTGRCYRDVPWDPNGADGPPAGVTPVEAKAGVATTGIDITVPR